MSPDSTGEVLSGWGNAHRAISRVYRPSTPEQVAEAFADARGRGLDVALRGAGQSYGDVALADRGAVVLLDGLAGEIRVDARAGTVTAPASATIERLWRAALPAGFWLPVVPGTMKVTLGGAIGANVHGKNHLRRGSFHEHLRALAAIDPDGRRIEAAGSEAQAWAGSLGLRGAVTEATIALKPVHSGMLDVRAESTSDLEATLARIDEGAADHEYAVAWVDAFAGARAGRGVLHFADDLSADHPFAGRALDPDDQRLPSRILGLLPRRWSWRFLKPFANDPGMRLLGRARFLAGRLRHGTRYLQTHAAFHFLLDYVPGWKRVYDPHGLLQVQLFLPREVALEGFRAAFAAQDRTGVHAWLGVVKRHGAPVRPHDYWRDGFSLALDLPVRPRRRAETDRLLAELDAIRTDLGGGLYAAKDGVHRGVLPPEGAAGFRSDLARRWSEGAREAR